VFSVYATMRSSSKSRRALSKVEIDANDRSRSRLRDLYGQTGGDRKSHSEGTEECRPRGDNQKITQGMDEIQMAR
jgi:hypothetical protein